MSAECPQSVRRLSKRCPYDVRECAVLGHGCDTCSVLILVDSFICYSYTGCQSYDFIPVSVYILTFIPKIVVTPKSLS
jgi:hypothetical protein